MNLIIAIFEVMKMLLNFFIGIIAIFVDEITIGSIILIGIIVAIKQFTKKATR